MKTRYPFFFLICLTLILRNGFCQTDTISDNRRLQYPAGVVDGNIGVSIGLLHYHFSNLQLAPGFSAEAIHTPPLAVKVNIMGVKVNRFLSADIHYLRPVEWVVYKNVNGDQWPHSVRMNIGGLTLHGQFPLLKSFSWYGEAGLAIVTRSGFDVGEVEVLKPIDYATFYLESGFRYALSSKWELGAGITFAPGNEGLKQPASSFYGVGFTYYLRPLSDKKIEEKRKSKYPFPHNTLQISLAAPGLGYGINNLITQKSPIPLFWDGNVRVRKGMSLHYHRNIFHAKKVFSLDWGASAGVWKTNLNHQNFFTISLFPIFRLNFIHSKFIDGYFFYSVAGPTFISRVQLDNQTTGEHFTFQDLMGIGTFIGKNKRINLEANIGHFSNGNIFTENPGITIPLTLCLGWTF